jgi:hypothetical protein
MMSFNDKVIESVIYRRVAPLLMVGALILAIAAVAGTYVNGRNDARRNAENALVACENANESRIANNTLWNYVVDLASRGANPAEVANLAEVRSWIGEVYAPHDCSDLSKKYPIPPPPKIPSS